MKLTAYLCDGCLEGIDGSPGNTASITDQQGGRHYFEYCSIECLAMHVSGLMAGTRVVAP